MPRLKKSLQQKEKEGTLRPRDGNIEDELALITPLKEYECPSSITNPRAIEAWNYTIKPLILTNRISNEDKAHIELAILTLQDIYYFYELFDKERAKENIDIEAINKITKMINTRMSTFNNFIRNYGITPSQRAQMASRITTIKKTNVLEEMTK